MKVRFICSKCGRKTKYLGRKCTKCGFKSEIKVSGGSGSYKEPKVSPLENAKENVAYFKGLIRSQNKFSKLIPLYKNNLKFWKHRAKEERYDSSPLAPLFVDDIVVQNIKVITFKGNNGRIKK